MANQRPGTGSRTFSSVEPLDDELEGVEPERETFNQAVGRAFAWPSALYARYPGFITVTVLAVFAAFWMGDLGTSHDWYSGDALPLRAVSEEILKGDLPPGGPYAGLPTHIPPAYPSVLALVSRVTGIDPFHVIGWASVVAAMLLPVVAYVTGKVVFGDWRPAAAGAAFVTLGASFSADHLGPNSLFTTGWFYAPVTPFDIGLLLIPLAAVLYIRAAEEDAVRYGGIVGLIAAFLLVTHVQSVVYLLVVLVCLGGAWLLMRPMEWRKVVAIYLTVIIASLLFSSWWWIPQFWVGLREGGLLMRSVPQTDLVDVGFSNWGDEFGLLLVLAAIGSVFSIIAARRLKRLGPVMVVAWMILPLLAGAIFADNLPFSGTLRGDRLALLSTFPMGLLAGLAVTEWRTLTPTAPGVYSFVLGAGLIAAVTVPTLRDQRDASLGESDPQYAQRLWHWDDWLGFAGWLRDRENGTGTATLVGDDPESGVAWFFAGNKPLAWVTPSFYSMAYNPTEVTGLSQAAREDARAEALSGDWDSLIGVAAKQDVRYAVVPRLQDRIGLSVATPGYLAGQTAERGNQVRLEQTDDGLPYLAMEQGGETTYRIRSREGGVTPFTLRVMAPEAGTVLRITSGPETADIRVAPGDAGQWVELPFQLNLAPGANEVTVSARSAVDVAAIYGYTEHEDAIPPGYRVRFDDGFTMILEIPQG